MSWPYWLVGAVIVVLLCLAFRRKEVADEIRGFDFRAKAIAYFIAQENAGFDCWLRGRRNGRWQVRCYRRKERQS
ncbi:hypothetical protein ACQR5W_11775 [Xanthomonas sacchari]